MKLRFNSLNPKVMIVLLSILTVLLAKLNPYLSLLLPWYLGFLMISEEDFDFIEKLALAPALGLGVVIFIMHILSWLKVSLRYSYPIIVLLVIALSLARELKLELSAIDRTTIFGLLIAVFLSVGIKIPFLHVPPYYGKDTIFHAYKLLEIMKENSLFISQIPSYAPIGIRTYPAGYHSILAWIILLTNIPIPTAMLCFRVFIWLLLPLATFIVSSQMFNKQTGILSSILVPLTYLYYYYLHYTLFPAFSNYYFFLIALFLYNQLLLEIEQKDGKILRLFILTFFIITTMLLIHPYSYLLFQAYAGITLVMFSLMNRRIDPTIIRIFIIQSIGSFLCYFLLEYPTKLDIISHSRPIFNLPQYSLKDNLAWFNMALSNTFIHNGQLFLGLCFIIGILYMLLKCEDTIRLLFWNSLLLTVVYDIFLILNKVHFHIPIPLYSSIWNAERIYILITPIIPIIEGVGLYLILQKAISLISIHISPSCTIEKGLKTILIVMLISFLMPSLFYTLIIDISFEKMHILNHESYSAFNWINNSLPPNASLIVSNTHDSGEWIPVFTGKIIIFSHNSDIPFRESKNTYVYIDSRGIGAIGDNIVSLNPFEFFGKYELLYFNSNIWIYNLSATWNATDPRVIEKLKEYYKLPKDDIIGTDFRDWKYLAYGFLLRNPVVIRGAILNKWNFAFAPRGCGYIVFVPTQSYNNLFLKVIFSKQDQTIEIWVNNKKIGEIKNETQTFRYEFKENGLYIIELESEEPFGFILLELE
ncbi:DUF6541 family protein [Thermococcus paralvinellae]|uniref:Glycosyltransferase RgtA/B/C/D-like domain-containing protein n=1 Tax=Thermococcus paralvinellae TaxID=582419 RepID=W0I2K3_9EURY|nr:DUF6541 family protein [Thermococcus paralvinellae]AHF80281.1 Hypothetical protein TES1_0895 [Thermococcus paralvinellae]